MGHPLGRLALLHPFPSTLNAALVAVLASVSGATTAVAVTLALAMGGFQVSIGALNDLVDAPADARTKPGKPIPAGLVSRRTAWLVVIGGAVTGALLSAAVAPVTLALGLAGYACGVAYDLWLKGRGVGWVAFTVAFPLLLLFAWSGGGGGLPPGWPALLPLAALAGPALQLANALTDLDHDVATGVPGLAVQLGRRRSVALLVALTLTVQALGWLMILALAMTPGPLVVAGIASLTGIAGLVGTARGTPRSSAWGWSLQAVSVATLAIAWVLAVA